MSLKRDGDRGCGGWGGGRKNLSAYMHHPWKQTIVWGRSVGVQDESINGEKGDIRNTYTTKMFKEETKFSFN